MDPYIQQVQDIETFWLSIIFGCLGLLGILAVFAIMALANSGEREHQEKLRRIREGGDQHGR